MIFSRQRPRLTSAHLIAVVALAVGSAGTATAAALITGKDIQDGTVTSADVKDQSLKLKDLKKSQVAKLRGERGPKGEQGDKGQAGAQGPAGATGATGAMGPSAYNPPPSGTLITGGGLLDEYIPASSITRGYVPLTFRAATPFTTDPGQRNIWFHGSDKVVDSQENSLICAGDYASPNPVPGNLCIYVVDSDTSFVGANSATVEDGVTAAPDTADTAGFYLAITSGTPGAQATRFPFVWAYRAP